MAGMLTLRRGEDGIVRLVPFGPMTRSGGGGTEAIECVCMYLCIECTNHGPGRS